jgi:uncharacterized protein YqgV (UPF0045/DUF77 family)
MSYKVNMAIQVLPQSKNRHPYDIVDKAIELIQKSGVVYKVCPFETVMEGDLDQLMKIARQVIDLCHEEGAEAMMTYLKIQTGKNTDITIDDKMHKYE